METTQKKWWTSKTVRAGVVWGIVSIVAFIGTVTGNPDLNFSAEFQAELLTSIMTIVTAISSVMAIYGRIKAKARLIHKK